MPSFLQKIAAPSANNSSFYTRANIAVYGNGLLIQNGDNSPSLLDDTNYGDTLVGVKVSKTFTIFNIGTDSLTINSIAVPTGYVLVSPAVPFIIGIGAFANFIVRCEAVADQLYSGNISINHSEGTYTFAITCNSDLPILSVTPSTWNFGVTPVGTPVSKIFTIQNTGLVGPLTIGARSYPSGFTETVAPSSLSLAVGASTTFTVRADAGSVATFSGNISIVNNSAENPKLISITANVEIDYMLDDAALTAIMAYAVRLLRRQYAGACLRLRRSSDNVESDFGFTLQGDLDTVAIATWLGAATGLGKTWYDQSGHAFHIEQPTSANQPLFVVNIINGKPVFRFDGINDFFTKFGITAFHDNWTVLEVSSQRTGSGTNQWAWSINDIFNDAHGIDVFSSGGTTRLRARDATVTPGITDGNLRNSAFRVSSYDCTGSFLHYWQNQIQIATPVAYVSPNPFLLNNLHIGRDPVFGICLDGDFVEYIAFNSTLSDAVRGALEVKAGAFYNLF